MKLRKKYYHLSLSLLILLLKCNLSYSQQTASFPEYNFNPFIINPAYAGLLSMAEATIANTGFSSFEGAPKNFNLSFHMPVSEGKMGFGAAIIRDEIGVTKSTNAFVAYSYKIFFDFKNDRPYWQNYQPGSLSFGITAGLQQYQDNLLELNIIDDINFSENINATIPTIGAGFLFNHSRFYVGVSAPNLVGTSLASDNAIKLNFPIYGYFGYRFFSNRFENFMLKPSLFLKHEKGAPFLADLNMSVSYKNKFELGAGYRTNSSFNLLAGIYLFKSFRVIYQYNIVTNDSPFANTHGLVCSFRFKEGYVNK
ncbi:PorP/SprF family type IX secretion system membrane protein [Winogradskyella sp. R77965]|uniref:PorP/SprF family type IX secretion system membrane protein n=1 Tax=Winogradskyella sp. R77965 TaxID=3093872 RepID=UPI0037DDB75D